jgi:thioredoxin 1
MMSDAYFHTTDATFANEVLESEKPTLVDFWATWCGPCLMMAPAFESLAEEYEGRVNFAKLDIDDNQSTAVEYNVMAIPTLVLFKDGREISRTMGLQGRNRVRQFIEDQLDLPEPTAAVEPSIAVAPATPLVLAAEAPVVAAAAEAPTTPAKSKTRRTTKAAKAPASAKSTTPRTRKATTKVAGTTKTTAARTAKAAGSTKANGARTTKAAGSTKVAAAGETKAAKSKTKTTTAVRPVLAGQKAEA